MSAKTTGCIGLDWVGNTGAGDDEPAAFAAQLGGRFARVVDDVKLCQRLLPMGITPLYREAASDDNAHRQYDPEAWAEHLFSAAPRGCVGYVENECREEDPFVIIDWYHALTLALRSINAGVPDADKFRCIGFNWGAGHPETPVANQLYDTMLEWVGDGHHLGSHEGYLHGVWETWDGERPAYPYSIGRHLPIKLRLEADLGKAVTWIVTEFASSYDAYTGWDVPGWRTEDQTANEWESAAAWYAAHGFYMIPFTFGLWQKKFAYRGSTVIKNRLVQANQKYRVLAAPLPQQGTRLDLAQYHDLIAANAALGRVLGAHKPI